MNNEEKKSGVVFVPLKDFIQHFPEGGERITLNEVRESLSHMKVDHSQMTEEDLLPLLAIARSPEPYRTSQYSRGIYTFHANVTPAFTIAQLWNEFCAAHRRETVTATGEGGLCLLDDPIIEYNLRITFFTAISGFLRRWQQCPDDDSAVVALTSAQKELRLFLRDENLTSLAAEARKKEALLVAMQGLGQAMRNGSKLN